MADDQTGEKTEQPTHKKLEDAHKRGQIWKSKDLTSSLVLLAGTGAIAFMGGYMINEMRVFAGLCLTVASEPFREGLAAQVLIEGLWVFTKAMVPVLAGVSIVALVAEAVMARGVFTADTVLPKMEKLDPIQGLKNLFSKRQLVELLKSMFKMGVIGWIVYVAIKDELISLITMMQVDAAKSGYAVAVLAGRLAVKISFLYAGLGIIDAVYQWRQYIKDMMMTREEVKQEYKQSEGDPHHKAARKQLHQEILQHEMVQEVKRADVIVTNPDHIAVAIKYDKDNDRAPKVIAKGQRVIAEQIKQIAKENNIPIMRNVPLAHALMRVELGEEIPEELYDAVAEVLNWVYSLAERPAEPAPRPKVPTPGAKRRG